MRLVAFWTLYAVRCTLYVLGSQIELLKVLLDFNCYRDLLGTLP